tara:strand:- start:55 stop:735 length:681 start_codon:yes stop_codon:yes gene_type:complete
MVLEKSHSFDTSKLSFNDVKTNKNGGKSIYISLDKSKFALQTPVMTLPYDMSVYDKGDYPKYSIELSFRDMEDNYRIAGFYERMEQLDNLILDTAVKNSMKWFGKKKSSREIMEALYTPIVKRSRDKETGEYDGKYPASIRVKLPFWNGKKSYEILSFKEDTPLEVEQAEVFSKGSKVQAIMKCGGVWIVNGKFGCTWSVEKVRVESNPTVKNYSFVEDDSDSDSD